MQFPEHIHTRIWPAEKPAATVVLCLHGIESHAEWFSDMAATLNGYGFDCVAYDRAGSGKNNEAPVSADDADEVLSQLISVFACLRGHYKQVIILGMSWGGLLAAYLLAKAAARPDSTVLVAPGIFPARGLPVLSLLKSAAGVILKPDMRVELPFSPDDFSSDQEVAKRIGADGLRRTRVSARLLASTLKMQRAVRQYSFRDCNLSICLPETDAIIDLAKTRSFADSRGVAVREFKGHSHCLILECPGAVADAVRDVAVRRTAS